jgi:hypothetical protein
MLKFDGEHEMKLFIPRTPWGAKAYLPPSSDNVPEFLPELSSIMGVLQLRPAQTCKPMRDD